MQINIGVLGPGNIAGVFSENAKDVDGVKIAAVASRDLEKSQAFAEKFNIDKAYGSYDELYNDDDIDLIYIATPHAFHAEQTRCALNSGKSVVCEKPFVLNVKDAEELITLAKEKNLLLMEAMWTRVLPPNIKVKEWIKDGKIGDLKFIRASFGGVSNENPESRTFKKSLGGGALYDIGIYPFSLALFLADSKISEYKTITTPAFTGVDESVLAIIKFENNALAQISTSVRAAMSDEAEICGTNGKIVIPKFWGASKAYRYDLSGNLVETFDSGYDNDGRGVYKGFRYEVEYIRDLYNKGLKESPDISFDYILTACKFFEDALKDL